MNVVTLASPWYPLALAAALAPKGPPRVVHVPFEQWLAWRRSVLIPEQSLDDMLAIVRSAFA